MARHVHGIPEINVFADKLRDVPKDQRRAVRKAIVAGTANIRQDMQRRAAWSTRIPAAIGTRVAFDRAAVTIRVDRNRAPHGRPYEGLSGATFRAPLYGNRNHWFPHRARPYFFPAVEGGKRKVLDGIERAIITSLPR